MEIINLAFSEDGKKVRVAEGTRGEQLKVKSDMMGRGWKGLTGGFGFRGSVGSNSFSCLLSLNHLKDAGGRQIAILNAYP